MKITKVPWHVNPLSAALLKTKDKLEQKLIRGWTDRAFSAESGTGQYGFENITGVGIAEKTMGGRQSGELGLTIYVVAKAPKRAVEREALVPKEFDGVPTDVVATGEFRAFAYRGRYHPAGSGVSVEPYRGDTSTLGCVVQRGSALFILGNNHTFVPQGGKVGDAIVQPGPPDGGRVGEDAIGQLSVFVPIRCGGPINSVDCAIAQTSQELVSQSSKCFGRISPNPVPCRLDLLVKKCGRTTQFTRGRITDCHFTGWVGYGPSGRALFQDQILIVSLTSSPFSQGGDSGSLIVTDVGNRPVGLLFAGSNSHTIANPIGEVLSALNVTIVA
ncbi:MAG: hypothetical protein FJY85_03095 [Deltaproteobacteria bacterium]|nr:hypothetical protein [Deltaproteobacteria bacterium]